MIVHLTRLIAAAVLMTALTGCEARKPEAIDPLVQNNPVQIVWATEDAAYRFDERGDVLRQLPHTDKGEMPLRASFDGGTTRRLQDGTVERLKMSIVHWRVNQPVPAPEGEARMLCKPMAQWPRGHLFVKYQMMEPWGSTTDDPRLCSTWAHDLRPEFEHAVAQAFD